MRSTLCRLTAGLLMLLGTSLLPAEEMKHGTLITEHLFSEKLRETRTGLSPDRTVKIYLPPGYATSGKSYPVVYYCHNLNWSPEQVFADGNVVKLMERGFLNSVVPEFILVAADYSTPTLGSWYENSSTTGRWLDYTVDEVVPFVENRFRTIKHRESRGLAGDFVGGYGALKLAMLYPDLFSVVYAMHPVGTGTGVAPAYNRLDWKKVQQARSFQDLETGGFARPFVAMCQAYLPNSSRPPLYCDFMVELENGEQKVNMENINHWQSGFLLDHMIAEKCENLRHLRGIGFDWARYDPNLDHVYANQAFTRKLDELGIEHDAEEYRGDPWSKNWTEDGRFYTRVLPFLNRHLIFQEAAKAL